MPTFDPDKYLQQAEPAQPTFDPDAYLSAPVAAEAPVEEEKKPELVGEITQEELDQIAKKHKLNPKQIETLKSNIGFFGTSVQGQDTGILDQAAGFISDAVGLGLPQKFVIETADTEEMKNALDDLRQLAESRKSGLRTAAEIGTSLLVPGGAALKAGKLATRAAAIAMPAIEMGARAKRGEEVKQAAIGGALGGIVGIAAPELLSMATKAKSRRIAESVQKQIDEMPDIEGKIEQKFQEAAPRVDVEKKLIKGEDVSNDEIKQFVGEDIARKVTNPEELKEIAAAKLVEKAKAFEKFAKTSIEDLERQGEDFMMRQYDRFIKKDLATEAIAETGLRGKLLPISGFKKLALKFSDNKPLAKIMDARLGTNIERTMDEMSKKHNLYTVALGDNLEELAKLRKTTRKAGVSEEELYRALDTGEAAGVPENVLTEWKTFFEKQRQTANELGMNIPKLTNYVPKRRLSLVKYTSAVKRKAEELGSKYQVRITELEPAEFEKLSKKQDFHPLLNEVEFTAGVPIRNAAEFNRAYNQMVNNPGMTRSALAVEAFTAKAREGQIPDFVLDKQTGNLASKWLQSTFRTIALRDGVEELKRAANIARKAGDDFTSEHLEALVQDVVGSRGDTVARAAADLGNKLLVAAQVKADKATNPFIKGMWEGVADAPLAVNAIMRQIYPNYLGMNPKSVLQNLTSPVMFTVPDMGIGYGGAKYLQSVVDVLATKSHGHKIRLSEEMAGRLGRKPGELVNTKNLEMVIQNAGLLPQQWTGEMVEALQEGLKSSGVRDLTRAAMDKYTKGMMYLFEKSEILARANSYFMGKRIAKDIIKDPKFGLGFVSRIDSPSYQRAISKAIKSGDLEQTEKLVTEFLNSNNMFNYDRVNMSAFGRYMGPMFSVFSKWPTSIAGRVMSDIERRGAVKGLARNAGTLMAPFAALAVFDKLTKPDDSDLYNRLVGRKGLSGWTPADSLFPIFEEGITQTPIGQTMTSIIQAATRENKKMRNAVNDALNTYMPGSGLLRFLGEDLSIYRGRAKPEGPKIERRLKEINKTLK